MSLGIPTLPFSTREPHSATGMAEVRQKPDAHAGHFSRALEKAQGIANSTQRGTGPPRVVPRMRTVLSGEQAAEALRNAWQQSMGSAPSRGTLSVLTAQWAHETGRGQSMMNFNFGGIKGTGPTGMTATYATHEGFGSTKHRIEDGFRAYDTPQQGAADYMSLLVRRYPGAISAAEQENPSKFVHALREGGYFTGDPTAYARSVGLLANQAYEGGFDAVGKAPALEKQTPQLSATASTRDYFSTPFASAAQQTMNPGSQSLQSFLATDALSRVALLISNLPTFATDGASHDSEPSKS